MPELNQNLITNINKRYPLYQITPEMDANALPYPQRHLYKGMSYSALKLFASCPKMYEYKYIQGNWPAKTDGQVEGNALHCLVLEPATFDRQFVVVPKVDKRTKAGKEAWAEFEKSANGRIMIQDDDLLHIKNAAKEALAHPFIKAALSHENRQIEHALYWTDTETSVRCQMRSDISVGGVMADLKTGPADERGFLNTIDNMYYDVQSAMYWDGKQANGLRQDFFVFFAIELKPPYLCAAYNLSPETMAAARAAYKYWISLFDAGCKTGIWPGLETGIKQVALSPWKLAERTKIRKGNQQ
jgi:exodeoxyribonuclease VIII